MLQLRFSIDGEEKVLPLSAQEIRFGRSADNEVMLPDYSVSRRHAALRRDGDKWFVFDLQSTNGVQVNQTAVQRSQVRAGDLLKVGVFEIHVEEHVGFGQQPAAVPALERSAPTKISGPALSMNFASPHHVESAPPPLPGPPVRTGTSTAPMSAVPPQEATVAEGLQPPAGGSPPSGSALSNATIIRSLSDFSAAYGLDGGPKKRDSSAIRQSKREALDQAYASRVFGFLTRLARLLITTESDDQILTSVMDIAFEAFPVDRGFILMREDDGDLQCELMRSNQRVEMRPRSEVPISKTMLEEVMRERVALLTYDALSDQRLAGTESVRIHQIRAAMCAPLWSGEKIIGVMQLDTPHHTGSFTEPDVDLLATLANYCAVAIERNRAARDAEFERGVRSRLERYHSPAVIEQVMQRGSSAVEEGYRGLTRAEVTVLFADIVGFTAFSEKAPPEEVAELMEGYFTHAVEAIFSTGGTLDKFIGDCVMAFFGAPMQQPDHALRAVTAAIRICQALDGWNAERRQRGLPTVHIRIAVNSGPVVVGDIGSNRRVDYTVLGNTVNVAARLEEKVAALDQIVVGEETYRQLAGRIPTEPLGEFQLKGLSQRISAHRVVRR